MADPFSWFVATTAIRMGISYLFPAEGPRLRDLRVSASTYGAAIPEVFGYARVAGNLIWSSGIKERKRKRLAGKGGGYYTEYEYYISAAYAFCKGPVSAILRVWADGKLVHAPNKSLPETDPQGRELIQTAAGAIGNLGKEVRTKWGEFYKVTIYLGTEEQLPDPVIESFEGEGNVPAYRGLCYMVFDEMTLNNFGNHIPQCAAEVLVGETEPTVFRINMDPGFIDYDTWYDDQYDGWEYVVPGYGGSFSDPVVIDWDRGVGYGGGGRTLYEEVEAFNPVEEVIFEDGISVWDISTGKVTDFIPASSFIPGTEYLGRGDQTNSSGSRDWFRLWAGAPDGNLQYTTPPPNYWRILNLTVDGRIIIEYSDRSYLETICVQIGFVNPLTGQLTANTNAAWGEEDDYIIPDRREGFEEEPYDLENNWLIISQQLSNTTQACKTFWGENYYLHVSDGLTVYRPEYEDTLLSDYPFWSRYYVINCDTGVITARGLLPYYCADWFLTHQAVAVDNLDLPQWYIRTQYYNVYDPASATDEFGNNLYPGSVTRLDIHTCNNAQALDGDGWRLVFGASIENPPEGPGGGIFPHVWFEPRASYWDYTDPGVVTQYWNGGRLFINKWSADTGLQTYTTEVTEISPPYDEDSTVYWDNFDRAGPKVGRLHNNLLVWPTSYHNGSFIKIHAFDTHTGLYRDYVVAEPCQILSVDLNDESQEPVDPPFVFDGQIGYYSPQWNTFWRVEPDQWNFDTATNRLYVGGNNYATCFHLATYLERALSLGDIVENLLRQGGLQQADFFLGPLYEVPVTGYGFANVSDIKSVLEDLRRVFLFDLRESNGRITATIRGEETPAAIVPQSLLGETEDSVAWAETRFQDADLPAAVDMIYMNKDHSYENTTAASRRIANPNPTMGSRLRWLVHSNVIMEPEEAKAQVTKILHSRWLERTQHDTSLPWAFLDLDPSDVIKVEMDDGRSYIERINNTEFGGDFSIRMTTLGQDSGAYEARDIEADGGAHPGQEEFERAADAVPLIYNTPLLRDADDTGGGTSVYYTAMGSARSSTWRSAVLWRSTNNQDYDDLYSETAEAEWGVIPAYPEEDIINAGGIDYDTVLTIKPMVAWFELSSVTDEELWNGANPCLWGDEVIQFRDANQHPDGSWTIATLLRGRRGTEYAINTHRGGEYFVTLDPEWVTVNVETLDAAGQLRYFKAAGTGRSLIDAYPETITYYPRDLMPYAVAHIERTLPGGGADIPITWVRRTRLAGGWREGTGDVPLNETSEHYEVYILAAEYTGDMSSSVAPTAYLRMYQTTSPTATYTSAEQSADGFDQATDTLHIVVYQISTSVGRGFPSTVSLGPGD